MPRGHAQFLVLALDIGSSSTRTALFDHQARRLPNTGASEEYSIDYRSDGAAELSPVILQRAVRRCLSATLRKCAGSRAVRRMQIGAVGGSAFWHGLIALDRNWRPLTPIFTWADSRAAGDAAGLRKKLSERTMHARSGCMLRASFWPAKLLWLRRTQPGLFRRIAFWVSPVDWIFHNLFGIQACSVSMASGTGMYDLRRRRWDGELCKVCHLKAAQLPTVTDAAALTLRLPHSLTHARVFPAIGDGAAGNLGSGADRQGIVGINVGTSGAVRMVQTNRQARQTKVPFGLFRYVVDAERSVLGGAVSNAGNLRQWCLRELRIGKKPNNRVFDRITAAADPLVVLPFWVAERAPTWPENQFGLIDGITQATKATDIMRAINSSVFYRLAQILELIADATVPARHIIVSGGILRSIPAIGLLADALGRDVEVAREAEASLRGAAVHALRQLGIEAKPPRPGRVIKHNSDLIGKHRKRRERQVALEIRLTRARH
jgi:gluconokinase